MTADPREHYTPYPPIVPTRRDDPPIYRALARDHARRASARRHLRIVSEAITRLATTPEPFRRTATATFNTRQARP